jgi:hypothetical protein
MKLFPALILSLVLSSAFATLGFTFEPDVVPLEEELASPTQPDPREATAAYSGGGGDSGNQGNTGGQGKGGVEPVDVIRNGGFELRDPEIEPLAENNVALEWLPYSNGRAHFGWYDDQWREVVHSGDHAQLMEIKEVYGQSDRTMGIYQTVTVVPNSEYDLTMYVMMRSESQPNFRTNNDFEMSWGIDFSGGGNYDNVDEWVEMPLTEQFRLGSTGPDDDDETLFYEMITGTVRTQDRDTLTLFIRGLKRWPSDTEILFDVDDVTLIGPRPVPASAPAPVAAAPAPQPASGNNLPASGGTLPTTMPVSIVVLGGIVLALLGASAAIGVVLHTRG